MNGDDLRPLAFFLGGRDLEMITIRELLSKHVPADRVHDKALRWGAKASDYRTEIEASMARGERPVIVELEDDLDLDRRNVVIVVDHHGAESGRFHPTSLHQIFDLLKLPGADWTRWYDLVAANDRGHIRAMREELQATPHEIRTVREADRAAQGITEEEEQAGRAALERAQRRAGGGLLVLHLPHARTATVADRVQETAEPPDILIVSPNEVNFFGRGSIIRQLLGRYASLHEAKKAWYGGSLDDSPSDNGNDYGFWGASEVPEDVEEVVEQFAGEQAKREQPPG